MKKTSSNLISAVFLLDQKDIENEDVLYARLRKMLDTLKRLGKQELLLFKDWAKGILSSLYPEKAEDINRILYEEKEVESMVYNFYIT